MVARSCASRAHQLAASTVKNGVGPSRITSASTCRCYLHTDSALRGASSTQHYSSRPTTASTSSSSHALRQFSVSTFRREQDPSLSTHEKEEPRFEATDVDQRFEAPDKGPQLEATEEESSLSEVPGRAKFKPEKTVGLITDDFSDAEPTLEYLDSLKPRVRRHYKEQQRTSRGNVNPFAKPLAKGNPEDKQWERTQARINGSFTRDQLASLARSAGLPGSYARKVRKDELIRRIMIHRFGMVDARERAEREKREDLDKSSAHISFHPSELYLLLARGSNKVRQEASKARVVILSQPPREQSEEASDTEQLGFWIRGKDQGITRMKQWVEEFKKSIKTREEEMLLSAEANDATTADQNAEIEVLPAELVRFISQLSGCFVEASPIQNGKTKLSLAYLEERDAQKAVQLLRQYQAENAEATQRMGAAAYIDGTDVPRTCSMLPFVPNEPTPWTKQADDLIYGSNSDVAFRVAHVPNLDAFSLFSTNKLPSMKLTAWSTQGETEFSEPFRALLESANATRSPAETAKEVEYSAVLGHVLFSGGGLTLADEGLSEEEVLSRLSDPLAAPRPGSWLVQHAIEWARDFRTRFGREASRFAPARLFRPKKDISLDIWLEKQGYRLAGDGSSAASSEKLVLVYQPAEKGFSAPSSKLEIVLGTQQTESDAAEGFKGRWNFEQARWVTKAESDMMIPEKSVDLRLVARAVAPVEGEAGAAIAQAMAPFMNGRPGTNILSEETSAELEAEEDGEDGSDLIGTETETIERSASVIGPEPRPRPASTLHLPDVGAFALESATRMTVQVFQQRSALASASPQPVAQAATPEPETSDEMSKEEITSESPDLADDADTTSLAGVAEESITASAETDVSSHSPSDPIIATEPITRDDVVDGPSALQATEESEQGAIAGPMLIRELTQDLATKATTESLRIAWRTTNQQILEWKHAVDPISALLDRHDMSTRR